jgi:asparagine synthase (glutamine-hydrolysing)
MCGIAGAWGAVTPGTRGAVEAMTSALVHRGPDDSGFHSRQGIQLGVRRLSIVDVAGGAQPVYNETGEICVVANGEIYNHHELRTRLQGLGHRFSSQCDTEVIVHLYEEYGDRCVEHLRGMFAFAVADGGRLLLARDRLGIKPLYYSIVPGGVVFASEIKALLRCPELRPALDLQAFADSRAVGYPVGDRTFIEGVRGVLPGHTITVTRGPDGTAAAPSASAPALAVRRYYSLPAEHDEPMTFDSAQDLLIDMLRGIGRSHLAADVEVGLILSGGLDSTVLAMLARDAGRPVRTFSVAESLTHPDLVQATRVADDLGWPHHVTVLSFDDYVEAIPSYVHAQEAPGKFGGLPLYCLYRHVGTQVKACLNGEGADEVFGGYTEYSDRSLLARVRERGIRSYQRISHLGMELSPEALEVIDTVAAQQPYPVYLDRLLTSNLRDQLVRNHLELLDKSAMAASVEMRVPFLDHRLVDFVASLPARYKVNQAFGIQKHVLKRAALRAWGGDGPLADSVLRRKIGAPTAGSRSQAELTELCERELPDDYLTRHELGPCFPAKLDLLTHELFCEIFLAGRGASPEGLSMRDFIAERAGKALSLPA